MDSYRWQSREVTAEQPQKRIFQHLKHIVPTDSVASKGQNIFWLIEMSIYVVLKAAITFYLLFCKKLVKYLFLRWLNALDILYYRLYIFAPRISLQGLLLISFEEISYAVIFVEFNKKGDGISEVLSCLNAFMVFCWSLQDPCASHIQ